MPWLAKKAAEAVVERKEADERDEKEIEEELLGSVSSFLFISPYASLNAQSG